MIMIVIMIITYLSRITASVLEKLLSMQVLLLKTEKRIKR